MAGNPICRETEFYPILEKCTPNLLVLDDDLVIGSRFYEGKRDREARGFDKVTTRASLCDIDLV
jgi:hypothetical protein